MESASRTIKNVKKKANIPFFLSAILFSLSLVALISYLILIQEENKAFDKVRGMVNGSVISAKEDEKEKTEGLSYYLIDGVVVQERFKDLYMQNHDFIGWIKIDDTPIDYPVMYSLEDEEFYLHRDFDKNYSFGGCIFAGKGTDIGRPSDNIITYGHHMANSSMYHDIDKYEDQNYYEAHKYIQFDTLRQNGTYEVIAAFRTEVHAKEEEFQGFEYWKFINARNEGEFNSFVSNCKALTPYTINTSASYGDQLLTLSTCAYHAVNGRFVVVARRVGGAEVDLRRGPRVE